MPRNKFGIPEEVLSRIRLRDKNCVYCGKRMLHPFVSTNRNDCATIEHLNYDGPFYWREGLRADDLVLCCWTCNSSRGSKTLPDWFKTPYCVKRNINSSTVARPVKSYLKRIKRRTHPHFA
jgi:hypothetical protein